MMSLTLSVIALLAANLVTIYGVLFLHWDLAAILLLYWVESAIIAVFNIFRMIIANPGKAGQIGKVFLIPFFMFHFGVFMAVHGMFLIGLTQMLLQNDRIMDVDFSTRGVFEYFDVIFPAAVGLVISHAVSFFFNFLGKLEFEKVTVEELFTQPYNRIIVMHFTIILGVFATTFLGQAKVLILIFVLCKTVVDLLAHLKEREKFQKKSSQAL